MKPPCTLAEPLPAPSTASPMWPLAHKAELPSCHVAGSPPGTVQQRYPAGSLMRNTRCHQCTISTALL